MSSVHDTETTKETGETLGRVSADGGNDGTGVPGGDTAPEVVLLRQGFRTRSTALTFGLRGRGGD